MVTFSEVEQQLSLGVTLLGSAGLALGTSQSPSAARMHTKMVICTGNLRQLRNGVHRLSGVCDDVSAFAQIMQAVRYLNNHTDNINRDPESYALAYGALFVGAGQLASHLPPPLNMYSDLLKGFGNFFVNVSAGLDPSRRPNTAGLFVMAYGEGRANQRGIPHRGATNL